MDIVGSMGLTALSEAVGSEKVFTDPDVLDGYLTDMAAGPLEAGRPAAVVRVRSTEDVVAAVRWARSSGRCVVPRGAGSGLAGGANALEGSIILSFEKMNKILHLDVDEQYAVVQPGVINADLTTAVLEHGLYYPPDPASKGFSTIGGNIATNAGGLCCVKYGVTRDYVLGLTVVLADGEVLRTGRRTAKSVAGYDLTSLLVGSEGTLAVITEATLRLAPVPRGVATLAAFFPTLVSAGKAVTAMISEGERPSLLEIMDQTTIEAVNRATRMGLDEDAAALLIVQSDLDGPAAGHQIDRFRGHCDVAGALYVTVTEDAREGEQLLVARREAYPALERLGATLLDDVAVPRTKICELIAAITKIAADVQLTIGTFGHAGDGNMHPTIVYDPDDATQVKSAWVAFERIVRRALDLGGTVTGEHGVGLLKREFLESELGAVSLELHRRIKSAFDPDDVMNPGKIFDQ